MIMATSQKQTICLMKCYIKNNTMYLSGTKWSNSKDVETNILNIAGRLHTSHKYKHIRDIINNSKHITHVAGYNLGGAVADQLANELSQIKQVRLYSSPTISSTNSYKQHIFYHELDPIQGLYENDVGKHATLYKGRFKGLHTLKGHQLVYSAYK